MLAFCIFAVLALVAAAMAIAIKRQPRHSEVLLSTTCCVAAASAVVAIGVGGRLIEHRADKAMAMHVADYLRDHHYTVTGDVTLTGNGTWAAAVAPTKARGCFTQIVVHVDGFGELAAQGNPVTGLGTDC